jgi:glycosyltransferase involved in cell wall biosynthesis
MKVKGIDLLFEAARILPEFTFQIVGLQSPLVEQLWDRHPPNVEIVPYITRKDLLPYFQQAKVYCQPSRSEGLPNSLCEAMLCECVPVGADVGAVRNVIGDAGFVVPPNDVEALTMALQDAMATTPEFARRARQRIARTYPLEDREVKLVSLVHDLIP